MGGGLTIGVRVGVPEVTQVGGVGSEVGFGCIMISAGATVRGEIGGGTVPIAGRRAGCLLAGATGGGAVLIGGCPLARAIGGPITARGAIGRVLAIGGGSVPIAVRGVAGVITGETVPTVNGAGTIPIAGATTGFRAVVAATTNPPLSSSFLSTDVIEDGEVACAWTPRRSASSAARARASAWTSRREAMWRLSSTSAPTIPSTPTPATQRNRNLPIMAWTRATAVPDEPIVDRPTFASTL